MRRRVRVAVTLAMLAAVALLIGGPSAIAQPAHGGGLRCAANVCLIRPLIKSHLNTPPYVTQIAFRVQAFVSAYPQTWQDNVSVWWWRSASAIHRPRGRWVVIHPTQAYREVDLPAPGDRPTYMRILYWTCEVGAFYTREHAFGITAQGSPQSVTLYFPWDGFVKGHPNRGDVHRPPPLRLAWHTSCQGHDELIG